MSTTNDALAALKAQMAKLQTDVAAQQATDTQILADVAKLLAGATTLPNGMVAVSAADIQALVDSAKALDDSVIAEMAADQAADAKVNPPAPTPAPAVATGTGVNQAPTT